jgi:hypothetical protein
MMLGITKRICLPAMVLTVCSALGSQDLPRIEGDSLAGHHVILPDAVSGKVTVLVLGFSKASKAPTSAWGNRLESDFGTTTNLALYQLPVLEEVPGFIRGMVISSMKKGVPENRREYFVPLLHGEADLKKLVNYKEPDDAYLILLDRTSKIVYQMHGPFEETNYAKFRRHIVPLTGAEPPIALATESLVFSTRSRGSRD